MGITNFCYLSLQMLSRWLICFFLSFWCDHKKSCWWFTIKITKEHLKREILWIYLLFSKNTTRKYISSMTLYPRTPRITRMLNFTAINKTFWSSWYYFNNLDTQRWSVNMSSWLQMEPESFHNSSVSCRVVMRIRKDISQKVEGA